MGLHSLQVHVLWRFLVFMRPMRIEDVWSYYAAVLKTIIDRALGRRSTVSENVHKSLRVRCDGVIFGIRDGTEDLGMAALSIDPQAATRFFQPAIGETVVDVGSNIGGYALRAALVAQRVIAIEPEPSNYQQLTENVRLNNFTNVVPMQLAISDSRGETLLHLAADSGQHSLEVTAWGNPTGHSLAVRVMTLDEVVASQGIECIDWLKVDVERHELPVLRGAVNCLAITQNLILEFELSKYPAISAILHSHGLEIVWHESRTDNSVLLASRLLRRSLH